MQTSRTIGKWFEKKCKEPLEKLCLRKGRMFYNFPDSASSRGLVPAQPGEFQLLLKNGAVLIECKASVKYDTFRSCMASMVRDAQYGWHKKWHLAGHPSLFVFFSQPKSCIEIWDGEVIVKARSEAKPLPKCGCIVVIPISKNNMDKAMEYVVQMMEVKLERKHEI